MYDPMTDDAGGAGASGLLLARGLLWCLLVLAVAGLVAPAPGLASGSTRGGLDAGDLPTEDLALEDLIQGSPSRTLSAYNLFKDVQGQVPNDGLVPYALATPLFSDYAEKYRFVHVPDGMAGTYDPAEVFSFPVGTVFVKSFGYPADFRKPDDTIRVLETRLLVREEKGWAAWPYVWNEEMTEATLRVIGKRLPVSFIDAGGAERSFTYRVPNKNQCKGCHEINGEVSLIGPKARNLNHDYAYASGPENQLAYWSRAGLLTNAPAPDEAPRVPVWNDPETGNVEERARAYLDINCAHCHRLEGPASNSGLVLTYDEDHPYARGIYKRPVAAGRGAGNAAFVIEPGLPDRSILLTRMMSREPGVAMPELGRALLHKEGISLVHDYIAALPREKP